MDSTSPIPKSRPQDDRPPSPKRQRTSTDSHFSPSSPSHMHPGPLQSAYDITQQALKSSNGSGGNTSDATAPRLLATSAPASTAPQELPVGAQAPKPSAGDAQAPPKFKIKRTGTSKLPPGHSAPKSPATQNADTVPASAGLDRDATAAVKAKQLKLPLDTVRRGPNKPVDGSAAGSLSRGSSASSTAAPSRPTSAGRSTTEAAKVASPQSLAMKRKWASGAMDHVARRAAETRRLNIERLNAAPRMSVISISDSSTSGSPPAGSSTPVPASAVTKKPSLAEYYRKTSGTAATKLTADSPLPAVVSDLTSSHPNTPEPATNTVTDKANAGKPVNLSGKKAAKKAPEPSTPHAPGTPFARSLSGRPYDMVPNEGGRYVHGFGALFPDGYAPLPDPDGKGPRWTCPVEFCTHERTYLKSHGKHFRKDHKACQLNDNGDGTFTVVGYNMDQNAPVVVSRNIKAGTATMSATGAAAVSVEERDVSDDAESVSVPTGKHRGELDGDSDAPYFFTPSGRPYTTYPNDIGRTYGVLIPDGYERLVTSSEKPWVCPVAPCLSSWPSQNGLSIHFARMHGGWTLNDNLDGTLSALRRRDDDVRFQSVQGWDRRDALVVRRGPMASIDEPSASTEPADSVKINESTPGSTADQPTASTALPTPSSQLRNHYLTPTSNARPAEGLDPDALETWKCIRRHLSGFPDWCPDSSWIPELLKLPKVRDIVWDQAYIANNGFRGKVSRDVATMAIQVTGEAPPKTCSRCRDGNKGPYGECIVISEQAPIDARLAFSSCASCIYNGQGTYCTAKFWGKKRAVDAAAEIADRTSTELGGADTEESRTPISGSQVRRSERVQVKEATAQSVAYEPPAPAAHDEDPVPPPSPPTPAARRHKHTLARESEGQVELHPTNTNDMEIEDWELAPGRLRSAAPAADGELPEDIAFSQPYLTTNQSVAIGQDMTFRVDIVTSGSSLRFAPSADRERICSVGAGKVKVRLQGEEEFAIGPHGMFRVSRGRSCVVLNRLYGNAVLHVTEVPDYS